MNLQGDKFKIEYFTKCLCKLLNSLPQDAAADYKGIQKATRLIHKP